MISGIMPRPQVMVCHVKAETGRNMNFHRFLPRRLRDRFAIIALACSGILFLCTAPLVMWQGRSIMLHSSLHDLNDLLELRFSKITEVEHSLRQPVLLMREMVQSTPDGKERWYEVMEDLLHRFPNVYGVRLAFEAGSQFSAERGRSYYVRRGGVDRQLSVRQPITYIPDDPLSQGSRWYLPARNGNIRFIDGIWSVPFTAPETGTTPVITCSVPVNRVESGKPVVDAVVGVDIMLESLLQSTVGLDIGKKFHLFILDQECNVLASAVGGRAPEDAKHRRVQEIIRLGSGRQVSFRALRERGSRSGSFIGINPVDGAESYFLFKKMPLGFPVVFLYVFPVHEVYAEVWWLAGGVTLFGIVFVGGMGLLFRWIAGPATRNLDSLRDGVRNVQAGNFTPVVNYSLTLDETTDVIDAFNGMVLQLQHSIGQREEMARGQQRMKTELELARDIQISVLHDPVKLLGGSHFSLSIPAFEVGGDFFDHFLLPGGRTVFIVGDVSGKGISAAMFMMRVSLFLRGMVSGTEPEYTVSRLNAMLQESNPQMMFVTLYLAILDPVAQSLVCVNCGHNPPLMIRADGAVETLSQRSGPALGVLAGKKFTSFHVPFREGDLLAIYTDGISDATDRSGEQFGISRMREFLLQNRHRPLRQCAEELVDQAMKWQGGDDRFDDITLSLILAGQPARELRLPASLDTIGEVVELVQKCALERGMEIAHAKEISLAVCEAVTNVIMYSLCEGESRFYRVYISWSGDDFVVRIEDDGPAFDPVTLRPVDVTLPLEERQIGGLGWFIIRQATDEVHMSRSSDTNILTLVRSINRPKIGHENNSGEMDRFEKTNAGLST